LASIALLQQGDPTVLGNRHVLAALTKTTGAEVLYRRAPAANTGLKVSMAKVSADASWDQFFDRARLHPHEEMVVLLADLESTVAATYSKAEIQGATKKVLPGFPSKKLEAVPASGFWGEEEVVFCQATFTDDGCMPSNEDGEQYFTAAPEFTHPVAKVAEELDPVPEAEDAGPAVGSQASHERSRVIVLL